MTEYLIRELPEGERPRERLLEHGGRSLADSELLAVLLRTGRRGVSALQMALDLLRENGGLAGLLTASPHSLRRAGIGPAKAATLLAAGWPASSFWTTNRSPVPWTWLVTWRCAITPAIRK